MSAGVKGTKGDVFNLTLPHVISARITDHAHTVYSTRNEWLRRFIIDNIEILAPRPEVPHA